MTPLGRRRAIELVQAGSLPIWLGSPQPHTAIVEQNGRFRIRGVVAAEGSDDAAPTGKIYAEALTRDELIDLIKTMSWPEHW